MTAWTYVAYAALAVALAAPLIWAAGHRAGRAQGLRDAQQARSEALGWMRVAITAERRADQADALLALDFPARDPR